jgi:hypothetical protein
MKHRTMGMAALGLVLLSAGGCASTGANGDDDTRAERTRRGIGNAWTSPLRDVGIIRPDIPDLLESMKYPYATQTLRGGCATVQYEIGQLDAVLGDETYQPGPRRTFGQQVSETANDEVVNAAEDLAGDVIPYRGWVRRLSGANRAERRYARAIEMGQMRRAFLRGYGASLGCRSVVPAPPRPGQERREDEREGEQPPPQPGDIGAPP